MISNYEIRENTLTQNSVFLLLLKADTQGCEDVSKELSAFCNLLPNKVQGFDYVFELSGITDDSMLEKVRMKIESLASVVQDITQTFDDTVDTATITVDTISSMPRIKMTSVKNENAYNIKLNEEKEKDEKRTITLADTGFALKTIHESAPAPEVNEEEHLGSAEEQEIELGEQSLRLADTKTDVNIMRASLNKEEKMPDVEQKEEPPQPQLTPVEEENKTLVSFEPEEMKNVSISLEKKKRNVFGGLFGKIKSTIKSTITDIKVKTKNKLKEVQAANQTENIKQEPSENIAQPQAAEKEKANPFKNLGSGLIVKKGTEEAATERVNIRKEAQEMASNSVTARLKVDDIFDAETVCEFYANQPEEQKEKNISAEDDDESMLEKLENEKTQNNQEKEKPLSEVKPKGNFMEESFFTAPQQIFTSKDLKETQESAAVEENKETEQEEKLVQPVKIEKAEQIQQARAEQAKEQTKEQVKEKKIDELKEELKKEIPLTENKKPLVTPKQEKPKEEKKKPILVSIKESRAISREKKTAPVITQKPEIQKTETQKPVLNTVKQEEHPMQEAVNQEAAKNVQNEDKSNQNPTNNTEKIDHTLHIATPAKNAKFRNYPIEMPLIPTYTFANMDISSIRFAHAMAMVTLDNLGTTNNPILIQGASGTGKTHFLHAMGYEISKKIPQAKILFTNGVRFSRGVQYLLERGQEEKLNNFFNDAEALIIDDVHLTAVNEHNRKYISKILNDFLKEKKQIVLSSKYPPESLKRFEELVNFKFSLGAIAELKVPNKAHFAKLVDRLVTNSNLDLNDNQIQEYFIEQNDSLGSVATNVKRVKVLSRRIESSGIKKLSYEEILKVMTGVNGENPESNIVKKDFSDVVTLTRSKENNWGNFGFFFPASQIDKFRWVAYATQEAAKELGISGSFNYALKSAYSTEHIISSAFKIANICDLKGLKGAVILGPALVECKGPIRSNFYDILTHMLEVMMIRCGTINFEDIKKPSAYVKMLGDILK